MSEGIPQPQDCGTACQTSAVVTIPGPKGDTGAAGADGNNGVSAYALTTAAFTVPAVSSNVTIDVSNSSWMIPGEPIFIQNAGFYDVVSKPSNASVTVKNLGYTGNAAPTTVIAMLQLLGPTGLKGTDGTVPTVTFNDLSPTTTKGDLIVDDGANNPNASDVRFPVGSDEQCLEADSTQAAGLIWKTRFLNGSDLLTFGAIGANGGTDEQTIAVVGAGVNDPVSLGPPASIDAGVVYFAYVSAPDVVKVRGTNSTGAPITPAAAQRFSVRVHK